MTTVTGSGTGFACRPGRRRAFSFCDKSSIGREGFKIFKGGGRTNCTLGAFAAGGISASFILGFSFSGSRFGISILTVKEGLLGRTAPPPFHEERSLDNLVNFMSETAMLCNISSSSGFVALPMLSGGNNCK